MDRARMDSGPEIDERDRCGPDASDAGGSTPVDSEPHFQSGCADVIIFKINCRGPVLNDGGWESDDEFPAMIHRTKDEAESRSLLLSRILDPEYIGSASPGVLGARSSLPQPSVFVDRWGQAHDPDFRPFGSHPVVTPAVEEPQWPWYDDDERPSPTRLSNSTVSSSFQSRSSISSGSRSRSASMLQTPPLEPDSPRDGRHISPPGHIPRASLFPWTPAQRATRVQHEVNKRNIPPPQPFIEEEREEIPLTLVDSRYVPGYGHFAAPPPQTRAQTAPEPESPKHKGRPRSRTVPAASDVTPESPGCSSSFRQSVYSFGLKTKLGLHHFKVRMRRASGAASRPHSL